jgi:hypothetical protein
VSVKTDILSWVAATPGHACDRWARQIGAVGVSRRPRLTSEPPLRWCRRRPRRGRRDARATAATTRSQRRPLRRQTLTKRQGGGCESGVLSPPQAPQLQPGHRGVGFKPASTPFAPAVGCALGQGRLGQGHRWFSFSASLGRFTPKIPPMAAYFTTPRRTSNLHHSTGRSSRLRRLIAGGGVVRVGEVLDNAMAPAATKRSMPGEAQGEGSRSANE